MSRDKRAIIGVDWGTSRTYPAILDEEGNCQSLLPSGNHLCSGGIPSLFAYGRSEGEILCDDVVAEELEIYSPEHVVSSVKMQLEKSFRIDDRVFRGADIAEKIIKAQLAYAEKELEVQDIEARKDAVVVCAPVSFGNAERRALQSAFQSAGYQVLRILPEPVAAAIYYGKKGTVLVVDIGAGTSDVALVRDNPLMTAKNPYPYLYIDSSGIPIAGDMFDEKIADYLAGRFAAEVPGIRGELLKNRQSAAYRRLKAAARKAKEGLSNKSEIGVTFNGQEAGSGRIKLTRQEVNRAIHPLVEKIVNCVVELLARNPNVSQQNLEIIMTGGSSYIPYIRERLIRSCGKVSEDRINIRAPEKAIGFGAAIYAANMETIRPRVDFSYGVNTYINDRECIQTLIPAGAELPYTVEQKYWTRNDQQTRVAFNIYEYRMRDDVIPLDDTKRMKTAQTVHEFYKPVPKGTECIAAMTLTEDGILKLEVRSGVSEHVGKTSCSVSMDSVLGE